MTAVVHVTMDVEYGRMQHFLHAIEGYLEYRRSKGFVAPEVLLALSGTLNRVCLVYRYRDLAQFDSEDRRTMFEPRFASVAKQVGPFDQTVRLEG